MYTNIFGLEFDSNFAVFALVTAFSAFVLSMAYQNVATSLKIKLIPQREKYISVSSELKVDSKNPLFPINFFKGRCQEGRTQEKEVSTRRRNQH